MSDRRIPPLAQHAEGLVTLLDAAGRTIIELTERAEAVEVELVREQNLRRDCERMLAELIGDPVVVPPTT